MKLEGIKANFLGDSITEGAGVSAGDKIYHAVLKKNCGLEVARNYGIGGTRIARQTENTTSSERHNLDFCMRVSEMDADADLIVVFGGTNDYDHGVAPMGAMNDRTEYTFYGACHVLARSLIERYPSARIVFMTPLQRTAPSHFEGKPPLTAYVAAIKEVCAFYSIPVLDLYATAGIHPALDVHKTRFMPDGLHPSDAGAARLAERLEAFLRAL